MTENRLHPSTEQSEFTMAINTGAVTPVMAEDKQVKRRAACDECSMPFAQT
jgi:hypothetical protein